MPRLPHGAVITVDEFSQARGMLAGRSEDLSFAFTAARPTDLQDFDFLFLELQRDPANLLLESRATRDHLVRLGQTMRETGEGEGNSEIPAAYTYFGQFVDHDLTFEVVSAPLPQLINPDLTPLPLEEIRRRIRNARTATLDLDSIYGLPAPRVGEKLRLGSVTALHQSQRPLLRPPGKDGAQDLPREGRSSEKEHDRAALIGDPRNDENTILQQLHVAFLRAHNALVERGQTFDEARKLLRQHYQYLVLHDFLKRVADPQIVGRILAAGNQIYDALAEPFFLPLEFTIAAFRFGHSMVRAAYDFNLNFKENPGQDTRAATLGQLFTFRALSGQLGDFDTLPENWIIEWENFVDVGARCNRARRISPKLAEPLFQLPDLRGMPEQGDGARLAVRSLLRGYLLRMPTGQAIARALGQAPLAPEEMEAAAASGGQIQVLREAGFIERTPLWYYLLAEAAACAGGRNLGPVGSTIVAEVLIGLVRRSADSILRTRGWRPTLPSAETGTFTLADLLRLAGVL